jgi:hypothetical protein
MRSNTCCAITVGERIKLGAELVRRLDLLQEKFRQLVGSVDAHNLSSTFLQMRYVSWH